MKTDLRYALVLGCLALFAGQASAATLESRISYRRFTTLDGLSQMQTETVWQDSRGYIYIGTLSGFVRYDGRNFTPFLQGRRENIVSFEEVDGQVRALGFVRQWSVRGAEAVQAQIDPQGLLLLNNFNAADLPSGYILLEDRMEQNRVLCRMEDGGMTRVLEIPLLDQMTPDRKIYVDRECIWLPTPQGLYRTEDGSSRQVSGKKDIFSLVRAGNRLLAFAADGIFSVSEDALSPVLAYRFEAPDYGLAVRQNRIGQLYIADAHTIWLYEEGVAEPLRELASGFNMIRNLFVDRWDRLWAATYQGAYCFFHCDFVNHRLTDRNDIVRAVAVNDGHLVTGTLNGSLLVDGRQVSAWEGNFYSPGAAVLGGRSYFAGNGDVVSVGDGGLSWLGLPEDRYRFVSRMDDRLVIAGRSTMLGYDLATGQLDTLMAEIVHPWCAVDDGQGQLWVSGNPGLYCLTGVGSGPPVIRKVKNTPTTLVISAMAGDRSRGRICYAVGDSLFLIRNGEERVLAETQALLRGHEIRSLHLSPKGYLVAATIDGLLVARLDGDDVARDLHWFDAENGFTLIEPLLGPMAESEDGTIWLAGLEEMTSFRPEALLRDNQEATTVDAPKPWWRHWWIWFLFTVLLLSAVWQVARLFEKRFSLRRMEALRREKTQKELQLQTVRLKAIPHFHSNVMSGIEYFIINKSPDEASRYLKIYADFTNRTLSDIDRPARTVEEEVDYVRTYLELEQLRYGERLQYKIAIAPDVDRNVLLPTMILHTYCQNAIKHGLSSKAGGGSVVVEVSRQYRGGVSGVLVAVADDGVGRIAAAQAGEPSTRQGLKILQQQIDLYNTTNRHPIVQQVSDLTDGDGRPAGTRFETWVPVDFQFQ